MYQLKMRWKSSKDRRTEAHLFQDLEPVERSGLVQLLNYRRFSDKIMLGSI